MQKQRIKTTLVLALVLQFFCNTVNAQTSTQYTLERLLKYAIENNHLLKATKKNQLLSHSDLEILKTTFLPEISLSANFSYWSWLQPNKKNILGGGNSDMYTEIAVYQTIYDWGENKVKKLMVNNDILLNAETERQIRHSIIFGVSKVYIELLKVKTQSEIYRNSISQLQSQLKFTNNLYNIGKASEVNLLRVKVKISTEEDKLQQSLNTERAQISKLSNMCFVENLSISTIDTNALGTANWWIDKALLRDSIYRTILNNHPILKASSLNIEKEIKQKELYRLENHPELFSFAASNWEDNYIPYSNNFNYYVGVGFRYKLPYLGAKKYKIKMLQSVYRVSQIEEEHKQQYLDLKSDIDLIFNDWSKTQDKLKNIALTIELSERALQNASLQYQSGLGSLIDVLDAQTLLTTSQIDYKQNSLALLQLLAHIHYLSGLDDSPFNL